MNAQEHIRNAFGRMAHVFAKKPEAARDTSVMRARVVDGLHCEAREGDWRFSIDMPVEGGGAGAGPTPGVHGRAALADQNLNSQDVLALREELMLLILLCMVFCAVMSFKVLRRRLNEAVQQQARQRQRNQA